MTPFFMIHKQIAKNEIGRGERGYEWTDRLLKIRKYEMLNKSVVYITPFSLTNNRKGDLSELMIKNQLLDIRNTKMLNKLEMYMTPFFRSTATTR